MPHIIVPEIQEAIKTSKAKKMYICNMITQPGETDNFSVSDHIKAIQKYIDKIDIVIANNSKLPKNMELLAKSEGKDQVIIDEEKLNRAASYYIGTHDFTSFCTQDARDMDDMRRTVFDAKVTREGDIVKFTVSADGFLYNMVRIMAGTLLYVAEGKINPQDIPVIIDGKDRTKAGITAIPDGLYLNKVFYSTR